VYEIIVVGRAERTLRIALDGLIDEWCPGPEPAMLALLIDDQSRMVAVIDRLHDLGISIDRVRQL
jgi:hypothetical protein